VLDLLCVENVLCVRSALDLLWICSMLELLCVSNLLSGAALDRLCVGSGSALDLRRICSVFDLLCVECCSVLGLHWICSVLDLLWICSVLDLL
jgi:hypothetical protein